MEDVAWMHHGTERRERAHRQPSSGPHTGKYEPEVAAASDCPREARELDFYVKWSEFLMLTIYSIFLSYGGQNSPIPLIRPSVCIKETETR